MRVGFCTFVASNCGNNSDPSILFSLLCGLSVDCAIEIICVGDLTERDTALMFSNSYIVMLVCILCAN